VSNGLGPPWGLAEDIGRRRCGADNLGAGNPPDGQSGTRVVVTCESKRWQQDAEIGCLINLSAARGSPKKAVQSPRSDASLTYPKGGSRGGRKGQPRELVNMVIKALDHHGGYGKQKAGIGLP